MNAKQISLVSAEEEKKISRTLLIWLNSYPEKPVTTINFEQLKADEMSMALSTIQGTYITRRYIMGGYQAEYQFKVIFRTHPLGNDDRLKADEILNALGDWATTSELPDLGEQTKARRITLNARSALFAAYDNGDEDHQILMTLIYEVIK